MEKSNRPQRNRRHSRRAWPPEDDLHYPRPAKRLFTPEIKRMLKEWLVRRRENPYPSREEKKRLAIETGLTYTQICNWFANWRRKLKNSEREKSKKSWGHLIKHYNNNAKGNVEQFSISSEDSIWEEEEQQRRMKLNERALRNAEYDDEDDEGSSLCDIEGSTESTDMERNGSCGSGETQIMDMNYKPNYYIDTMNMNKDPVELFIGREVDVMTTTATCQVSGGVNSNEGATKTKYKQKMMEKYLRDTTNNSMQANNNNNNCNNLNMQSQIHMQEEMAPPTTYINGNNTTIIKSGAELSKWLESAAKFTPNKNNYYIEWNSKRNKLEKKPILTKTFLPTANTVNLHTTNTTVTMLPLIYSTTPLVQRENSQDYHQRIQHNTPQQTPQQHHHNHQHLYDVIHHKDELDAAEALANLAFNCRQKMLDSAANGRNTLSWPLNPISS